MKKIVLLYLLLIVILAGVILFRSGLIQAPGSVKSDSPQITIKNRTFELMLAKSEEDMVAGLTKVNKLDTDKGMLFVFSESNYYPFWMKNMKYPIDIVFINEDKVVDMYENVPAPQSDTDPANIKIYKPKERANYVLEVASGVVKENNIKVGDQVEIKNVD